MTAPTSPPETAAGAMAGLFGTARLSTQGTACIARLALGPDHAGPDGNLEPAVIDWLARAAMAACLKAAGRGGGAVPVSLTLDLPHRCAPAGDLVASADLTRATRTLAFLGAEIRAGDRLVGMATAVWRLEA